ncbi:MAG: iron-siderophore ABC transporter substrate-binding protein [Propionibacteriaceae bacterium]|nr:iron-siderophore ABC transporter substrate-binding protein [Propionibacteriaceae bacterium]
MRTPARWSVGLLLAATLSLAACSANDPVDPVSSPPSTADGAYPVVVETKFGPVTVESAPQRVVALGWGDAETALALGVQPVGASDWLGFGGDGVGPWSEGLYSASPTIVGTMEPSFEEIAALRPDLILDVRSSGDSERYARLTAIAPTIGVPVDGDAYLTNSDQQVRMIAAALGQVEAGEALIAQVEAAFQSARQAHPDWAGLTATAATRSSESWGAYVEGSDRVIFLERLGFVQSPAIAALKPNEGALGFSVSVSAERLDLFDADLVVAFPIWIPTTDITDDPGWRAIPAIAAGHDVVIDGDLSNAYSVGTVPGILYALQHIVPLIADALA